MKVTYTETLIRGFNFFPLNPCDGLGMLNALEVRDRAVDNSISATHSELRKYSVVITDGGSWRYPVRSGLAAGVIAGGLFILDRYVLLPGTYFEVTHELQLLLSCPPIKLRDSKPYVTVGRTRRESLGCIDTTGRMLGLLSSDSEEILLGSSTVRNQAVILEATSDVLLREGADGKVRPWVHVGTPVGTPPDRTGDATVDALLDSLKSDHCETAAVVEIINSKLIDLLKEDCGEISPAVESAIRQLDIEETLLAVRGERVFLLTDTRWSSGARTAEFAFPECEELPTFLTLSETTSPTPVAGAFWGRNLFGVDEPDNSSYIGYGAQIRGLLSTDEDYEHYWPLVELSGSERFGAVSRSRNSDVFTASDRAIQKWRDALTSEYAARIDVPKAEHLSWLAATLAALVEARGGEIEPSSAELKYKLVGLLFEGREKCAATFLDLL